jgi:protein gp37
MTAPDPRGPEPVEGLRERLLAMRAELVEGMVAAGVRDPVPGIWLGVSAEDERRWDERVPILRDIPTAIRWASAEPQLARIDRNVRGLDWIVQGGESGPASRPFDLVWARLMRDRCRPAGAAYFLKQLGDAATDGARPYRCRARKGDDPTEWPDDLGIREWPAPARVATAPRRDEALAQ